MNNSKVAFDYEKSFMGIGHIGSEDQKPSKLRPKDSRLDRCLKAIKWKKGKIVEVGCGGGLFIESLKEHLPHLEAYGCDISKKAIEFARRNTISGVKYEIIDSDKLPYKDETFDICIAMDVVEHVKDINQFFSEIYRILKKGGIFHFSVSCEGNKFTLFWLFSKIKLGSGLSRKYLGHIQPDLTTKNLLSYIEKNGFKNICYSNDLYLLSQINDLIGYFIPNELLELLFGKKTASDCRDSSIVNKEQKRDFKLRLLLWIRTFWVKMLVGMNKFSFYEAKFLRNLSITSLRVHMTCEKV